MLKRVLYFPYLLCLLENIEMGYIGRKQKEIEDSFLLSVANRSTGNGKQAPNKEK